MTQSPEAISSPQKLMLRALKGETLSRPPVWLMRQAGRYLPEYREVRSKAAGFLDLCYTPDYAVEVTLQPIRRYGFDAAILFSDILVLPHALGQKVWFEEGVGPRLEALEKPADLDRLDRSGLHEHLAPVYETVGRLSRELPAETTLIGFAGAPWTVASYMLEGGSSKDFTAGKAWAYGEPDAMQRLIDLLVAATGDYLIAQIDAGAEAVQVFDSWAGIWPEAHLRRWCLEPAKSLVQRIKAERPGVPVIVFPRGAGVLYQAYAEECGADGLGLDTTVPLGWARQVLQPKACVQGNLDPLLLVAGGESLRSGVETILQQLSGGPFVFNLGGPDSREAVQPFLFNLFFDPAIIGLPLPLRWLLAKLISKRRAPIAEEIYQEMGGGSPLLPNTEAQAAALTAALQEQGLSDVKVFIAMRYWHPRASETAQQVAAYAPDRVVLLPLYPQYSTTTSASSLREWGREAKAAGLTAPSHTICCYPEESGFIEAMSQRLREALRQIDHDKPPRVLFSAHGLPKKIVEKGDPYQWQVEQSVAAVVSRLGEVNLDWQVCYQSRVGPLEWIGPATDEEIEKAGREGRPVIVVPIAFVSEHSETLVELDIEYRELAEKAGAPAYLRVPTVRDDAPFITGLAELVRQAAGAERAICSHAGGRFCPARWSGCPQPVEG